MKKCSTCGQIKAVDHFYADKRRPDGLKSQCKSCHTRGNLRTRNPDRKRETNAVYMARARAANPDKFRARDREASRRRIKNERTEARREVHAALRAGRLARPSRCGRCGLACTPAAHHHDYSKPLEVEWLCSACHGKEHRHG